jgi:hypothetical protein
MKKQLRKPENWQDFETLCKILWGEIWNCPEIKKNGRKGQKQQGVDICGIPQNENQYFGIQCKGKDDYLQSELTEKEIDEEVSKALKFIPPLKKFYFATTANKDSKIEEYIRLKNKESFDSGHFEIHLFSWEDIVDLIDANKRTHDWYINNIDFKTQLSVNISFSNGESHLVFKPILLKNHVTFKLKDLSNSRSRLLLPPLQFEDQDRKLELYADPQPFIHFFNGSYSNKSSCVFSVLIKNNGTLPLEFFKLYISFKGTGIIVDTVDKRQQLLDSFNYSYNTHLYRNSNDCLFEPTNQILVQTDSTLTDEICIRPTNESDQDIVLDYEFVAKDFNKKGNLTLRLEPIVMEMDSVEETTISRASITRLDNFLE